MFVMKGLFGEEPEKQRPADPQDAAETPSMCPNQRRASPNECAEDTWTIH
jgi:hypothetical protein